MTPIEGGVCGWETRLSHPLNQTATLQINPYFAKIEEASSLRSSEWHTFGRNERGTNGADRGVRQG